MLALCLRDGGSHCLHFRGTNDALGAVCFLRSALGADGAQHLDCSSAFARLHPPTAACTPQYRLTTHHDACARACANSPANIPADPRQAYRHDGWQGWGHWLGTGAAKHAGMKQAFLPFDEATAYARSLNLASQASARCAVFAVLRGIPVP